MLADVGRDLIHRALGPIAARLPHVNPNVLTVCGFGMALLGGYTFYLTDRHPIFFLVAAGIGCIYGLLDAFDGMIARTHGKTTAFGDFLDHSLDRAAGLAALGGLAAAKHTNDVLMLLLMLATLWHGFLGTQMEASFGSRVYRGVGIAESLLFALVYTLTAFVVQAAGLPFFFREPLTGATLSVSDAFAILGLGVVAIGTYQRFAIARALGEEKKREP